jgi:hypothetical protein
VGRVLHPRNGALEGYLNGTTEVTYIFGVEVTMFGIWLKVKIFKIIKNN